MRIVFFGTPELAVPSLEVLAAHHDVCAVVCQPDKPQGRSKELVVPPVKECALRLGIPVNQPVRLNDGAFEGWLRAQAPEVCVLVAYGRILKQPILDVPKHGFLNMHPSLLPRHRGPSPIQTSILEGDTETGITIMRLDAGTDSGDILLQERMAIAPDDSTASLSGRVAKRGAVLLGKSVGMLESGAVTYVPQDHSKATHTRMYAKEDGAIRWNSPARELHLLVRAANPWPVAYCNFRGELIRVHAARSTDEAHSLTPGTVLRTETDAILVGCGQGALALTVLQAPGRKPLTAAEFLRGRTVRAGDRFEDA